MSEEMDDQQDRQRIGAFDIFVTYTSTKCQDTGEPVWEWNILIKHRDSGCRRGRYSGETRSREEAVKTVTNILLAVEIAYDLLSEES